MPSRALENTLPGGPWTPIRAVLKKQANCTTWQNLSFCQIGIKKGQEAFSNNLLGNSVGRTHAKKVAGPFLGFGGRFLQGFLSKD